MPDPWIDAQSRRLLQELARIQSRLSSLRISVPDVKGAVVMVNGRRVGSTPLSEAITVIAGTVVVEIEADGYRAATRTLQLEPGAGVRARFDLVAEKKAAERPTASSSRPAGAPTPPAATAAESTTAESSAGLPAPASGPKSVLPGDSPPTSGPTAPMPASQTNATEEATASISAGSDLRLPAYISAGGAVIGVGVGVAFLLVRNNHIATFNDDATCLLGSETRGERCGNELDSANTAEAVMTGAFIGGGVLAAAAALLFLIDDNDESPTEVAPGPGDVGVSVTGRF